MATYKLMQDIEAEDHILGPLSLRQFIFALIAVFFGYLCFIVATKGVAFLLVLFLPPTLFFGFFAFPFGKDQPTEVWFLAKMRFWLLPRKRIWDQSGVKELVTITVPKKVERVLTDGLSQLEVKSRLNALANTIDSRGWAIKNVNVYSPAAAMGADSDRLIDLGSIPQDVPAYDTTATADMLDTINNPIAQQVDAMVNRSAQEHHNKLVQEINAPPAVAPVASSNNWFMGPSHDSSASVAPAAPTAAVPQYQPPAYVSAPMPAAPTVLQTTPANDAFAPPAAMPTADEAQLMKELKQHANSQGLAYGHMRTLRPASDMPVAPAVPAPAAASDPTILALANNNDLNVETLARQAHKTKQDDHDPDEVIISLR